MSANESLVPSKPLFFFSSQMYLNYLANYVPNAWNYEHGCGHCHDDVIDSSQLKVSAPGGAL